MNTRSPAEEHWDLEHVSTWLVTCPDCALRFDAVHTDTSGGWSCPQCEAQTLRDRLSGKTMRNDYLRALDDVRERGLKLLGDEPALNAAAIHRMLDMVDELRGSDE